MNGLFITLEGIDASGKSTQIENIKKYFEGKGYDVVLTREPGGTDISEKIREIILDKENIKMHPTTEALLYAASRAQHVHEKIKPALDEGKIVLCDRFVDSSVVYQGIGRNLGMDSIYNLNLFAMGDVKPDFTLLFDIDFETSIQRKVSRQELDRLENERNEFHKAIFDGYNKLKELYEDRIVVVDASGDIETVEENIKNILDKYLERE